MLNFNRVGFDSLPIDVQNFLSKMRSDDLNNAVAVYYTRSLSDDGISFIEDYGLDIRQVEKCQKEAPDHLYVGFEHGLSKPMLISRANSSRGCNGLKAALNPTHQIEICE